MTTVDPNGSGDGASAPAPTPPPADSAPASAPAPAPSSSLDAYLDAEEAALIAAGVDVDGVEVQQPQPGDQPAAQPATQPTAPTTVEPPATGADPRLIFATERMRQLEVENARLAGLVEGSRAAPAAQPPATQPPPARPQPTPAQVLAHFDGQRAELDKKYDDGEIDNAAYRTAMRAIDRREAQLHATVISHDTAVKAVQPLHEQQQQRQTQAVQGDMWLRESTAALMAQEPWLAAVPESVLKAFREPALALARQNNLTIDETPRGVFDYRRCLMAVAKGNGMHRAYGAPGTPQQPPAGTAPIPPTQPAPGSQPIPAPRVTQPPNLALHPGGQPAPIGGITADRVATMGFFEAAETLTDEQMEAIAASR